MWTIRSIYQPNKHFIKFKNALFSQKYHTVSQLAYHISVSQLADQKLNWSVSQLADRIMVSQLADQILPLCSQPIG